MGTDGELSLTEIMRTTLNGMKATVQDALKPEVTEEYPAQRPNLPWGTKAQLYVLIEDCIACFKCSKACPTDCIRIDAIKVAPGALSDTSDGHKRMFEVIRFDIDMAQCCYCGYCTGRSTLVPADKKNDPAALTQADKTAACPTDCINFYERFENGTSTPENLVYHFANFTHDEAADHWKSNTSANRRTTHPGKPEANYESDYHSAT